MVYTGGTTGMPKGVMYAQGDLSATLLGAHLHRHRQAARARWTRSSTSCSAAGDMNARYLPACPQMHGTGFFGTMSTLLTGGCVVTVDNASLDADAIWTRGREEPRHQHGDRRRSLRQAAAARARRESRASTTSRSVVGIGSSGAMWSAEVKQGLLEHLPQRDADRRLLLDRGARHGRVGDAEGRARPKTAAFMIGPNAIVIDDDDQPIEPGSGKSGRLAVGGVLPVGYYKDEEKTAALFKTINGKRFSIPGDYAIVESRRPHHAARPRLATASTPPARRSSPKRSRKP